ncbi:Gyltl1b, partial [Symbiodinium sp. CCMP2456]
WKNSFMPTTSSACWTCLSVTARRVCWLSSGGPSWWESRSMIITRKGCIDDLRLKCSRSFKKRTLRFMSPGWFSSWGRSARRWPTWPRTGTWQGTG